MVVERCVLRYITETPSSMNGDTLGHLVYSWCYLRAPALFMMSSSLIGITGDGLSRL